MWKNEHRTNAEKPMWNMHDSIEVAKSMWIEGCKTVLMQVSQIHADSEKNWEKWFAGMHHSISYPKRLG